MDPISSKGINKSISSVIDKNVQDQMNKPIKSGADKVSDFEQIRMDKANEIPKDEELKVNEAQNQNVKELDNTQKIEKSNSLEGLKDLTNSLEKSNVQLDNLVKSVMQDGKSFTPSELMALQAQIYQLTREIELTSKVVEQANQGLKTMLNQQV